MVWDCGENVEIKTTQEKIFAVLKNVEKWPEWDVDLTSASLKDPHTDNLEGAEGKLNMKNGKTFDFKLKNIDPPKYVGYLVSLPGADTRWYWEYSKVNTETGVVSLRMGVEFSGIATFLYRFALKTQCEEAFKVCTSNLKSLLEKETEA
ncbi:hypothetical protein HK096_002861 [Nowakowskiella sp. JEL0078]|nr:hypothetical protein HK096_002861 [Nowakowskiella sp. JEL0078]